MSPRELRVVDFMLTRLNWWHGRETGHNVGCRETGHNVGCRETGHNGELVARSGDRPQRVEFNLYWKVESYA